VRFVTMSALVAAALALAGACGGSSDDAFGEDDVKRILRPPSAAPMGSSWVKREASDGSLEDLRAQLRQEGRSGAVADALERAGLLREYEWAWTSRRGTEAVASAAIFRNADGAAQGFEPLQDISYNWFSTSPTGDLGEEAIAGRSDGAAGYTWRRDNLILTVSVFQSSGPAFDYAAAARAYANELDDRADAR